MGVSKKLLGLAVIAFVTMLGFGAVGIKASAAETVETPKFEMVGGAQVRTEDPSGIRFVTKVNESYKAQLSEEYPSCTFVWGTKLTTEEKTWDSVAKKWLSDGTGWYTALVDIPNTDYLTEIKAESYVKIYNAENTLVATETVSNAQTRSIAYSASWALNDGYNQDILYTYTKAISDTSVELDKESESVVAGTEIQLNANAQPAGYGVAWRSSDTSVATVDKNGKVTAINAGEAIITATLGNATDSYQLTVTPSAESQLVTEFYMKDTDANANVYHQADFAHVKGVVSEDNFAYGKYDLGDGRTNATTMYATLSYEYMKTLFAANIVEIKFDVILSVADKKLQINARDLPEGVSYTTSSAEVNGKTYYVYTVTMERAYYGTLSKDITLRYTFGKDANNNTIGNVRSEFFFIDNLTAVEGEIELLESSLVTKFYRAKDTNNGYDEYEYELANVNDIAQEGNFAYGTALKTGGAYNSSTMYAVLSYEYMKTLFADASVTEITFDVILSTGNAKIQDNSNSNSLMKQGATSSTTVNGVTYHTYTVTLTRERYTNLTKDMKIRYTGGGNSTFFYVDNLALVK